MRLCEFLKEYRFHFVEVEAFTRVDTHTHTLHENKLPACVMHYLLCISGTGFVVVGFRSDRFSNCTFRCQYQLYVAPAPYEVLALLWFVKGLSMISIYI
jgi:hypothetical protein